MQKNYSKEKSGGETLNSHFQNRPVMRKTIFLKARLALTLKFLAIGESFRSLQYQFRISKKAIEEPYLLKFCGHFLFAFVNSICFATCLNQMSCNGGKTDGEPKKHLQVFQAFRLLKNMKETSGETQKI